MKPFNYFPWLLMITAQIWAYGLCAPGDGKIFGILPGTPNSLQVQALPVSQGHG